MKGLPAAICAVLIAAPALADNRPAACSNATEFQSAYDCPTAYVEMQPPPAGRCGVLARVAVPGDQVRDRHGQARARQRPRSGVRARECRAGRCPADSDSALEYLIAEIDANVVNPCLLVQIRANEVFAKLDEKVALDLIRETNPNDVQTMRNAIRPLVETKDFADRRAIYSSAREFCGATMSTAPQSVRVESDAIIGSKIKKMDDRQALLDELVGYIHAQGWKCDSISAARMHVFSRGFGRELQSLLVPVCDRGQERYVGCKIGLK